MFPITFADSHFTLGAFSFKVFETKSKQVEEAISGLFFVANSIASIQVALSGSFAFFAKSISSSILSFLFSNHLLMVSVLSLGFILLSFKSSWMSIDLSFLPSFEFRNAFCKKSSKKPWSSELFEFLFYSLFHLFNCYVRHCEFTVLITVRAIHFTLCPIRICTSTFFITL